jgi:hypothetical protein
MTDNGDYYVCEYNERGRPIPAFGPYPLDEAYTIMELLEQSGDDGATIPPSYTVLAPSNHRKKAHDST